MKTKTRELQIRTIGHKKELEKENTGYFYLIETMERLNIDNCLNVSLFEKCKIPETVYEWMSLNGKNKEEVLEILNNLKTK
jgi:hypothetical protein